MRIGFDISQTGRLKAGCGYFADGLIRELTKIDSENQYILYPAFGDLYWDPDCATSTFSTNRPNVRRASAPRDFGQSQQFWRNPPEDFEERLGRPDIVHANNFFCPKLERARLVYTLHDLSYLEEPAWTTEDNRAGCFSGAFNASLYADLILSTSKFSRSHFLLTYPHFPADRIVVAYPGCRFEERGRVSQPASLGYLRADAFWLIVATLEPRKNHHRLLEAYARLISSGSPRFPLVLAGGGGWLMEDLDRKLDELKLRGDVVLTGYVDDQALQWLYQNCFAFVYPSLFEGFGLPVLEAMAMGAPVITSNTTSLPEIVADAGLLIDPLDANELFEAMSALSVGKIDRRSLAEKAIRQAALFSWKPTADLVLRLYQEVLAAPKRDALR